MFTIFSYSMNVTVTSKMGYRLFTCIKGLICVGVIYTPKIILFYMFVALKWLKTSIETLK